MKASRLTENFIDELNKRIPQRAELVKEISRILKIEKEPASRRLSGNVSFSIDEMGKLAKELGISIDFLLNNENGSLKYPVFLEFPWSRNSMEYLTDITVRYRDIVGEICTKPYDFGTVFNALPPEIYVHYPNLMKLSFFKWGHFLVASDEFQDYASWKIPEKLLEVQQNIKGMTLSEGKRVFVWDESLVWTLAKEIKYLHEIHVISTEDKELIKRELYQMLVDLENEIKNSYDATSKDTEVSYYVSSVHLGLNTLYAISDAGQVAFSGTRFTRTGILTDLESVQHIRKWIFSLKKISSLISGSGYKERRLFFKEQVQIIDMLLG